jgi:tetratricopeptide (TPR) repeat protein
MEAGPGADTFLARLFGQRATVPVYTVSEGLIELYAGRADAAIAKIRGALEMDPALPLGQAVLGQALAEAGRWEEAIPLLRSAAPALAPGGLWARGYLGSYLGRMGDDAGARLVLDELLALRQNGVVQATAIAAVYTGLGEADQAVEWLEQAAQQPGGLHFWIPVDPVWKPLADHPGFRKILSRWKRTSNPGH